ncbi:hypothetical protein HanXRQr2_Chr02g0083641 [Helianthus annuus]|uniref:Uncharacterized protein n=1 Tax=Helianthus annuus TaxID=4232 RepID=A0A9K3JQM2_HELAN|nr:hypothetical protein HanXRQr2_Chr02g0083641 [Helianthus annuus]
MPLEILPSPVMYPPLSPAKATYPPLIFLTSYRSRKSPVMCLDAPLSTIQ